MRTAIELAVFVGMAATIVCPPAHAGPVEDAAVANAIDGL